MNLKLSILSVLFILQAFYINAQNTDNENIKALKVAFITEQLTLTTSEAEKFWPIYNYYTGKEYNLKIIEIRKLRHQIKAKGGIDAISDNEADLILKRLIEIENEIASIKNEMNQKLKPILSSKKLIKLQIAEFEFNRKVLEELRKKRMERFRNNQ
ncbi:MAG: hypothetical protein Q8S44_09425 [Flavobacteriaceae bacterium]|nr:hypothetical protein [Flavobacteriaceae bacterium]